VRIEIIRNMSLSSKVGEYGPLLVDGWLTSATREQPRSNNRPGLSCIPEGEYELLLFDSRAHGHMPTQ
jgi:hypothetical protein